MENDFKKVFDLVIQTHKLTGEVLRNVMQDFLAGKSEKTGNLTMRQLSRQAGNGKLDSIAVTENNIQDFLQVAKKYDVNFAIKRDKATNPPTYHVIFQSSQAEHLNRAFQEYASQKLGQLEQSKKPYSREKLQEMAREIANQDRTLQHKEKDKTRKREETR